MNKKGFASSTIIYGLLSIFLIAIVILIFTLNSNVSLNKSLNKKTIENIEYGSSSLNDLEKRITELESRTLTIDDIYPVGSIYISTVDATEAAVQKRFGETTEWERYSDGKMIIGFSESDSDFNKIGTIGGSKIHYHFSPLVYGSNGYFAINNKYGATTMSDTSQFHLASYSGSTTVTSVERYRTSTSSSLPPYIVTYMYKRIK